jgi:hypothetical protein
VEMHHQLVVVVMGQVEAVEQILAVAAVVL